MKIKNKLRKLNCEQLSQLSSTQTDPQTLLCCGEILKDRNTSLFNQRKAILQQIFIRRESIQKTVIELKDSMKQKLRCNQKVIVDKNSRPTAQQMKNLSATFLVTQKQRILCQIKDKYIISQSSDLQNALFSTRQKINVPLNTLDLDQQYQSLNKQCSEQLLVRDELLAQRDRLRNHYASIEGQIEECRKVYEEVEDKIMKAQRQLIQLTSYLDKRAKQDKNTLDSLRKEASTLEYELLKGQQMINSNRQKNGDLQITYREATEILSI